MGTHHATQRSQQGVEDQGKQRGGRRAQDQRREVVQVDAGENQLAVAAGANQEGQRSCTTLMAVAMRMPESITGQALGNSTWRRRCHFGHPNPVCRFQ
ncbi:Uncharacterised protein [Enterobacter cloacae]|uniref:Uncharacterized protein n=1 Tax=Enterobacter cloacae TaxID=550 RepID=A0A377M0L3_ENTCL|nr:Uncharacterised protein [Enterobacter cloacae]